MEEGPPRPKTDLADDIDQETEMLRLLPVTERRIAILSLVDYNP